jgi:hypothetical protein
MLSFLVKVCSGLHAMLAMLNAVLALLTFEWLL